MKVRAHVKAGNTWMSPGQGVQGQDQPAEVAQGGQWGPGQGDTGPVQVLLRMIPPWWQKGAGDDLESRNLSRV